VSLLNKRREDTKTAASEVTLISRRVGNLSEKPEGLQEGSLDCELHKQRKLDIFVRHILRSVYKELSLNTQ
jgi:hypothetical protein